MQATKFVLALVASIAVVNFAHAKTDPECLNHLGGSASDVQCYSGLTDDVLADSQATYQVLKKTIPPGNLNAKLLDEYMQAQNAATRFCMLDKESDTGWKPSPTPNFKNEWDVIYAECIYDQRLAQNKRLHGLLPDAGGGGQ